MVTLKFRIVVSTFGGVSDYQEWLMACNCLVLQYIVLIDVTVAFVSKSGENRKEMIEFQYVVCILNNSF